MRRAIIPIAEGFEEIEAVVLIDVLRRADVDVRVAGLTSGPVRGSRGVVLVPDCPLDEVLELAPDAVILPGGRGGAEALRDDDRVRKLVTEQLAAGRIVAAICAAPIALATAGLLAGRVVTSHPSVRDELGDVRYSETRVVVDGTLVTSRGPGTALELALELVELLCGADVAESIAEPMLPPAGM